MTPDRLRQINLDHFRKRLSEETDPERRRRIAQLMAEEEVKPDSAYPPQTLRGPL